MAGLLFPEEHGDPQKKMLTNLKESMLKGEPFPKLHAKAAETKTLLEPLSAFLKDHLDKGRIQAGDVVTAMAKLVDWSHAIDILVDSMEGYAVEDWKAKQLESLIYHYNVGLTKLCHFFHAQGRFLFNFVPKNHYLFHLGQRGRFMSPKLAWCYQGEDLMNQVKGLAQGSYQGTLPRKLGSKVMTKYLVALELTLSDI